jgi:hypothetical protein
MNLLFLSYWGIEDGLSSSTVIPHLKILSDIEAIDQIFFYSIEREAKKANVSLPQKVLHIPLRSSKKYQNKIFDFVAFPLLLRKAVINHRISLMFCRGTPAGALGYLVHRLTRVAYMVESFEPHAQYMIESHIWSKWGLRYNFQRYWEKRQMQTARFILPLSDGMKKRMIDNGVPEEKILVMPCAVDSRQFVFSDAQRVSIRKSFDISPDCVTGIYVGKFGGLYYDQEAFEILAKARQFFAKFRVIILSPDNPDEISGKLADYGFTTGSYHIINSEHGKVPGYLSAADFAFAFIRPTPAKKFVSAIKIGEYWSVGLPVLITDGIGDDSALISTHRLGAVFKLSDLNPALLAIRELLGNDRSLLRSKIRGFALQYRNFDTNKAIYRTVINAVAQGNS